MLKNKEAKRKFVFQKVCVACFFFSLPESLLLLKNSVSGLPAALTVGANDETAIASRCLFHLVCSSRGSLRRQSSARCVSKKQRGGKGFLFFPAKKGKQTGCHWLSFLPANAASSMLRLRMVTKHVDFEDDVAGHEKGCCSSTNKNKKYFLGAFTVFSLFFFTIWLTNKSVM
ncbi:hypothetical protein [Domibacillus robiginosus]|uniref:hypothetical protein n=1 Tax=Domibacillus robiginosus TaxID=1071054 RepID=UPI00067C0664|nr:hypothetical protein [Domibacillus robiginosus]